MPVTRREAMLGGLAATAPRPAGRPGGEDGSGEGEKTMNPKAYPFRSKFLFEHGGIVHPVYRAGYPGVKGAEPGVLLMHEMPGMTPEFWRLAHWVEQAGFTVYAPDLYAETLEEEPSRSLLGNGLKACVSREIHLFARNDSSPVTAWLRALAAVIYAECGGPGIGAVGLCMTGNFALSLVLEEAVIAPVASEPSLPIGLGGKTHAALAISPGERQALKERSDVNVMALRFDGDPVCRKARFDALEALIGSDRLTRVELPDSAKNPDGNRFPHAVLTKDLIDEDGSLTRGARDRVLGFLATALKPDALQPVTP